MMIILYLELKQLINNKVVKKENLLNIRNIN